MSVRKAIAAPRFAPTPLSWSMHLAFAALAVAAMVGPARANPVGGVVVGGQASIVQPSPALTQINQSSQRAVIDWRSFSIGVGEAVRFNQPSASAATLNRVVGNDPSSILGSLSANGRVYLVNQNGVFIGRDAQVDAAALVLSTANVSNGDFMAGRLNFNQPGKPGARIVNEGRITAADGGLVAMVAPGVENRGVISAKLGQVILSGAPAFSLDLFGDGLVNIVLNQAGMRQIADATGKPLTNYVDNSGRVVAEGGRIWISAATARGLVDGMVNISGELRATRVAQRGGEITLLGGDRLNVSGSVIATNADGKGGSIAASADKIVLTSNAVLDASGRSGGGTVLVGGSSRGVAPVPGAASTASSLNVAQGVRINADATGGVGHGGVVVLWSENDTRLRGSASASAGAAAGDGGVIEVMGREHLAFEGRAVAIAPSGSAGAVLLDPSSPLSSIPRNRPLTDRFGRLPFGGRGGDFDPDGAPGSDPKGPGRTGVPGSNGGSGTDSSGGLGTESSGGLGTESSGGLGTNARGGLGTDPTAGLDTDPRGGLGTHPSGHLPSFSGGADVDLSAMIHAALPSGTTAPEPGPEVGKRDTGLSDFVTTAAIESRASRRPESLCPARDRQVVGRSAGDEADIGATPALRGAPRPVFWTTYTLGEVSEQLSTADRGTIASVPRSVPCL